MKCLHTSVIMLYSLILCCLFVIFSHYFPPTMSNAVLICHTLFRLSPLIWHALPSNFCVACFHWCNDFEEFYHTIISAASSHNYFFFPLPPDSDWIHLTFFFPIFDMHPHLTMNDMNFPCFLLCPLICCDKFCKILVSEYLDILHFLSGLNVFIFKVWGKQKYKHQTYI